MTSAQFKNSLLLYAVQIVGKIVVIFIRDRALQECPLCRSQYGCWSATSIETFFYDVIYMHLECSLTWETAERVFLDNVGASETLPQLPEHMKLNPLLCGWVSPMLETRIRGPCLVGDRSSTFEGCFSGSFILLVDGPPGSDSVVMGDIPHNVWVYCCPNK